VFTIHVTGIDSGTGKTTEGFLHFVDLIASDSHLEATKVESSDSNDSDKTLPGGGVDQSLKCLADVFLALSTKDSQIPYRGSKVKKMGPVLLLACLPYPFRYHPSSIVFLISNCLYFSSRSPYKK